MLPLASSRPRILSQLLKYSLNRRTFRTFNMGDNGNEDGTIYEGIFGTPPPLPRQFTKLITKKQ